MEAFSLKFSTWFIDLTVIVTASDQYSRFKVEMVTDETDPILLKRSNQGEWTVVKRGQRNITDEGFKVLQKEIETYLRKLYAAVHMLVLSDFSEVALNAAKCAVKLGKQLGTSKLMLYHSAEWMWVPPLATAQSGPQFAETQKESLDQLTAIKSELDKMAGPQVRIEVRTDEKNLVSAVNLLAKQERIGLVVVGMSGKSKLERNLIGSSTSDLAKNCNSPLLIVPPNTPFKKIEKVVLACDLKQVSKSTPFFAIKVLVDQLGASLLVLNVDSKEAANDPDIVEEISALHKLWDGQEPEYHFIDHYDVVGGIMEFADRKGADLVITVPKVYGFLESLFHQSTATKLAFNSHIPILLFRNGQ